MRFIARSALVLFIVFLVAALVGCQSAAEKAAEELTEAAFESGTGADVEIDDDGVTIETDDGTLEVATEAGTLPDDFPEDFPVREDDDVDSSSVMAMGDSTNFYVGFTSHDDFDTVYDWYVEKPLSEGWESTLAMTTDTDGMATGMLGFEKGENQATVSVQEEDGLVTIAVTVVIVQ